MSTPSMSKELTAMVQVEQSLQGLTEEECARVLNWACARYGVSVSSMKGAPGKGSNADSKDAKQDGDDDTDADASPKDVASLAEFYDAASPSTDAEKALVVGYWIQFREGASDLEAQKINTELKHLGHGIGNVTRALDSLKAHKPALMIQKRKEGTTKQARKKFMVTNEGKKQVERMLAQA